MPRLYQAELGRKAMPPLRGSHSTWALIPMLSADGQIPPNSGPQGLEAEGKAASNPWEVSSKIYPKQKPNSGSVCAAHGSLLLSLAGPWL